MAETYAERIANISTGAGTGAAWGFDDYSVARNDDDGSHYGRGWLDHRSMAIQIAREADAEFVEAHSAVDPEIDRGLPLHERIAILRMQRDSFADFAEEVAKAVGMEGESGNDVLDAVKAAASERDAGERLLEELAVTNREQSNALVKASAEVDSLRERLAIAEAELDNLRGAPGAWAKTADERDREREKADLTNRARAVLAHWLALLTGVEERQIAAAAWRAESIAEPLPGSLGSWKEGEIPVIHTSGVGGRVTDHSMEGKTIRRSVAVSDVEPLREGELNGIMDGPEMMPNDGERVDNGGDE